MINQQFDSLKDWIRNCHSKSYTVIVSIADDDEEIYIAESSGILKPEWYGLDVGYYKREWGVESHYEEGCLADNPEEYAEWVEESDRAASDESDF